MQIFVRRRMTAVAHCLLSVAGDRGSGPSQASLQQQLAEATQQKALLERKCNDLQVCTSLQFTMFNFPIACPFACLR